MVSIVSDLKTGGGEAIRVKGGSYTRKSTTYVDPLFALSFLPTAMNLPMVCPPVKGQVCNHKKGSTVDGNVAPSIGDLLGGYLNPHQRNGICAIDC